MPWTVNELHHQGTSRVNINAGVVVILLTRSDTKACSIERFLRIHSKLNHVAEHLHVSLRLHKPAHHPERRKECTIFHSHARDNGVVPASLR